MISQSSITLVASEGRYFFRVEARVRLEAGSSYTKICFSNRIKMISDKMLQEFVAMLDPLGFVRTHRTHLVNPEQIFCVTPYGHIIIND